jgi:hypothetical protein
MQDLGGEIAEQHRLQRGPLAARFHIRLSHVFTLGSARQAGLDKPEQRRAMIGVRLPAKMGG